MGARRGTPPQDANAPPSCGLQAMRGSGWSSQEGQWLLLRQALPPPHGCPGIHSVPRPAPLPQLVKPSQPVERGQYLPPRTELLPEAPLLSRSLKPDSSTAARGVLLAPPCLPTPLQHLRVLVGVKAENGSSTSLLRDWKGPSPGLQPQGHQVGHGPCQPQSAQSCGNCPDPLHRLPAPCGQDSSS